MHVLNLRWCMCFVKQIKVFNLNHQVSVFKILDLNSNYDCLRIIAAATVDFICIMDTCFNVNDMIGFQRALHNAPIKQIRNFVLHLPEDELRSLLNCYLQTFMPVKHNYKLQKSNQAESLRSQPIDARNIYNLQHLSQTNASILTSMKQSFVTKYFSNPKTNNRNKNIHNSQLLKKLPSGIISYMASFMTFGERNRNKEVCFDFYQCCKDNNSICNQHSVLTMQNMCQLTRNELDIRRFLYSKHLSFRCDFNNGEKFSAASKLLGVNIIRKKRKKQEKNEQSRKQKEKTAKMNVINNNNDNENTGGYDLSNGKRLSHVKTLELYDFDFCNRFNAMAVLTRILLQKREINSICDESNNLYQFQSLPKVEKLIWSCRASSQSFRHSLFPGFNNLKVFFPNLKSFSFRRVFYFSICSGFFFL